MSKANGKKIIIITQFGVKLAKVLQYTWVLFIPFKKNLNLLIFQTQFTNSLL
jgi:hypothetical protein